MNDHKMVPGVTPRRWSPRIPPSRWEPGAPPTSVRSPGPRAAPTAWQAALSEIHLWLETLLFPLLCSHIEAFIYKKRKLACYLQGKPAQGGREEIWVGDHLGWPLEGTMTPSPTHPPSMAPECDSRRWYLQAASSELAKESQLLKAVLITSTSRQTVQRG